MTLDRTQYIGSHDIAAIMPDGDGGFMLDVSPYSTPFTVWAHKRGIGKPFEENLSTKSGLALEPVCLEVWWATQKHFCRDRYEIVTSTTADGADGGEQIEEIDYRAAPECVVAFNGERGQYYGYTDWYHFGIHLRSKSHPRAGCSPDALIWDTVDKRFVAGVDAKSCNNYGWEKYEPYAKAGIPANLKIQGDYMCAISGLDTWYFPVLHKGCDTIHEFTHTASPDADGLLDAAQDFWDTYVATGKQPTTAGTKYSDYAHSHVQMHGIGDGEMDADEGSMRNRARYERAHRLEKKAKAIKDAIKTEERAKMGKRRRIVNAFKIDNGGSFGLDTKG